MTSTSYYFLPVVRQGLANQISEPASGQRPTVFVSSQLLAENTNSGSNPGPISLTPTVQLYGPGDILGFDPRIVVRTDPRPGAGDFEPNYFTAIEFADVDFAWRFTADTAPAKGLIPWITLIVLAIDPNGDGSREFTEGGATEKNLPHFITAFISALPDLKNAWQWAHVQVADASGKTGKENKTSGLLKTDSERAVCRLLCPRHLDKKRRYAAFVVPTFELGRQAGRGELTSQSVTDVPLQSANMMAWDVQILNTKPNKTVQLPYYYRWEFTTSEKGDFEYLLSLLEPRYLPDLGLRPINVAKPGFGVAGVDRSGNPDLDLEGALKSVDIRYTPWGQDANEVASLQTELADLLNQPIAQAEIEPDFHRTSAIQNPSSEVVIPPAPPQPQDQILNQDPWVTPPIYGRWHAGKKPSCNKVVDTNSKAWLDTLNLDPRHRVAAGLGAEVVRRNQEDLMASAWEQLGKFEPANQILRNAQLGRAVSTWLYERVRTLLYNPKTDNWKNPDKFLRIVAPVLGKFLSTAPSVTAMMNPSTVSARTVSSILSQRYPAKLDPSLRHVLRPRGPIRLRRKTQTLHLMNKTGGSAGKLSPEFDLFKDDYEVIGQSPIPEGTMNSQLVQAYWDAASQSDTNGHGGTSASGSNGTSKPHDEDLPNGNHYPRVLQSDMVPQKYSPLEEAKSLFWAIEPSVTITKRVKSRLKLHGELKMRFLDEYLGDPLDEIMAAPEFTQAMYEPLRDLSEELLLPGVERIRPNTIGLLKVNRRFMESYLCGLNHEFAGELVWRGYPTDQRGSYFRQFWSVSEFLPSPEGHSKAMRAWLENHGLAYISNLSSSEKERILQQYPEVADIEAAVQRDADEEYLKDVQPLHQWKNKPLGGNAVRPEEELVLVVRGDLLRRYPSALIYAVNAVQEDCTFKSVLKKMLVPDLPEFTQKPQAGARIFPIFRASLPPDLTFFGFPFSLEEACGDAANPYGKFFIFEERLGEPRFGLDESLERSGGTPGENDNSSPSFWDDLAWDDVSVSPGNFVDDVTNPPKNKQEREWAKNSATQAWITMQKPVRRAVHAKQMLPRPCIESIEPNHGERGKVITAMITGKQISDVTKVIIPGGATATLLLGGNDQQLPIEVDIDWWVWPRQQEVIAVTNKGALQNKQPVMFTIEDARIPKIHVEIHNDLELTLVLEEKTDHFLERLTNFDRYSLFSSKALAESRFDRHPVGTGPFIFSAWTSDSIVLVRNPKYWANKAAIDVVIFKFTHTQASLEELMFARQLEMCITRDPGFEARARQAGKSTVPLKSFFRAEGGYLIHGPQVKGNFIDAYGVHLEKVQDVRQLRFGILLEPQHLDPRLITDPFSLMISSHVLEGLMRLRQESPEIVPCLAERVTVFPNQLSYAIKLRPNITFHDGSALNAQVVADNLTR